LRECSLLLDNIFLQENVSDKWIGSLIPLMVILTKWFIIFYLISIIVLPTCTQTLFGINMYLLKSLFAWKLINNRIPTKDNLVLWGVLPTGSMLCSGGCSQEEIIKHLFLECDFYGSLWHLVFCWLGIYTTQPGDISSHAIKTCLQEGNLWLF